MGYGERIEGPPFLRKRKCHIIRYYMEYVVEIAIEATMSYGITIAGGHKYE